MPIFLIAGTKVVRSINYASRLKINPQIAKVQQLKQDMLDLDHIEMELSNMEEEMRRRARISN